MGIIIIDICICYMYIDIVGFTIDQMNFNNDFVNAFKC